MQRPHSWLSKEVMAAWAIEAGGSKLFCKPTSVAALAPLFICFHHLPACSHQGPYGPAAKHISIEQLLKNYIQGQDVTTENAAPMLLPSETSIASELESATAHMSSPKEPALQDKAQSRTLHDSPVTATCGSFSANAIADIFRRGPPVMGA